jgi:hypothetical protein
MTLYSCETAAAQPLAQTRSLRQKSGDENDRLLA